MIPIKSGVQKVIIKKLSSTKRDLVDTWDGDEFSLDAIIQNQNMLDSKFVVDKNECKIHIENESVYLILICREKDVPTQSGITAEQIQELNPPRR